eukprot:4240063-Pleurochrysis_carterae.AAC.2
MTRVLPVASRISESASNDGTFLVTDPPDNPDLSFPRKVASSSTASLPSRQGLHHVATPHTALNRAKSVADQNSLPPVRASRCSTHRGLQTRMSIDVLSSLPGGSVKLRSPSLVFNRFALGRGCISSVDSMITGMGPPSNSGSDTSSFNATSRHLVEADRALPTRIFVRGGRSASQALKRWWRQGSLQVAIATTASYWYLWAVSAIQSPHKCVSVLTSGKHAEICVYICMSTSMNGPRAEQAPHGVRMHIATTRHALRSGFKRIVRRFCCKWNLIGGTTPRSLVRVVFAAGAFRGCVSPRGAPRLSMSGCDVMHFFILAQHRTCAATFAYMLCSLGATRSTSVFPSCWTTFSTLRWWRSR